MPKKRFYNLVINAYLTLLNKCLNPLLSCLCLLFSVCTFCTISIKQMTSF